MLYLIEKTYEFYLSIVFRIPLESIINLFNWLESWKGLDFIASIILPFFSHTWPYSFLTLKSSIVTDSIIYLTLIYISIFLGWLAFDILSFKLWTLFNKKI